MPRLRIQSGDVPASAAAQRMDLTLEEFNTVLPRLIARGFPKPDIDTGKFDLDSIDQWRKTRHSHLWGGRAEFAALDASTVARDRIEAMRGRA